MADQSNTVLAYWGEHRQQMRQSESQRAVLTNYVVVIASALAGFAVQQKLSRDTLVLAVLIILVGIYGTVTVAKYHERAEYHVTQARALTRTLVDLGALPPDETLLEEYRQHHYQKYPRLHRLRLHALWTGMHGAIAVLGLALLMVILAR